ncbi:hypothetical protein KDA_66050 [Dictyobacter alpinus]|uniref:Bacterial transcriptional activator domain-containing protein n=1 Tax=Dictyobacter alpinus TaxID=2014873 RepID=A0A402BI72_9CHLR|nr:DUF6788 family protein [Dictyobacter alpinus]GCE31121.1 hypothetical protein KDA_66050 [Dictyobacter alpinus]
MTQQVNKITYHQQVTYCGKPRCRRCREGIGHGPYWYAYQTVNGQTTRTYIGKELPSEVQSYPEASLTPSGDSAVALHPSVRTPQETAADNVVLRISTLGQFRLEKRGQARSKLKNRSWHVIDEAAWQQRSVRALLAYLICCPDRRSTRSQAIAALWPDDDLTAARSALNKTLNVLRKVLGHPSVKPGQTSQSDQVERFRTDGDWFILGEQERVWIDVDEFEKLAQQVELADSQSPAYEELLQKTITLYSGDFLPEERSAEWVMTRRQALRRKWIELLLTLSNWHMAHNQYAQAINVLNSLLVKDPTNELAIQQLMISLMYLKRRGEALRAYQRFENTLLRDYKATPAPETLNLYQVVRSGEGLPDRNIFAALPLPLTSESIQPPPDSLANPSPILRFRHRAITSPLSEPIGRAHAGTLIGRDAELQLLRTMLQHVERNARLQLGSSRRVGSIPLDTQRQPQLLFLKGDAGIGKTRLAEELGRDAQRSGWSVIWNHIYNQESGVPYRVWIEALRKILGASTNVVSLLGMESLRALSTLPGLLDLLPPDIHPDLTPHMLLPEQARYVLYNAVCDLLKKTSENGPLMIVLDDIQWADVSSYELLGHLARQLTGYPIVFFATCRESEIPKDNSHPLRKLILEMQREHTIRTLDIEPLSPEQIKLLVTSLSNLSEETVTHIQTYAAGNPFFAEELARSPKETLPVTITEALGYRMKHLKPKCRELLAHAAVLGGSFELPIVCMMETGSDIDEDDVILPLLEEALEAKVLTDEGSGTRITYHFWHPLLVTYLYEEGLSSMRRARLHRRAADAILYMNKGREEDVAATVTIHLERAGADAEKIAHYAELAGNNAYVISAYADAATHYQKVVDYLETVQVESEVPRLISLLERLAECTVNSGGNYGKVCDIFMGILELRRRYKQATVEPQEEARIQALLWDQISWTWRYRGDIRRAWECLYHGEQLLTSAGIAGGPVWARLYYTRGNIYQSEGLYDRALDSMQQAASLFEASQKQSIAPAPSGRSKTQIQRIIDGDPDLLGRIQRHIGAIVVDMGQLSLALEYQNQALAFFEHSGELRQIAHLSCNIGFIHLKMAEYEQAAAALRLALNRAEQMRDLALLSLVHSNLGELGAAVGNLDEAEKQYNSALKLNSLLEDPQYMSKWNSGLAGILQERGNLQGAASCIYTAFSTARAMHNAPCIGQALVALGNLRIAQSMSENLEKQRRILLLSHAQQDIERALELGVEAEVRMKGQLALAQITLLRSQPQQASAVLEQVRSEAKKSEHLQIVRRVDVLLSQIK